MTWQKTKTKKRENNKENREGKYAQINAHTHDYSEWVGLLKQKWQMQAPCTYTHLDNVGT